MGPISIFFGLVIILIFFGIVLLVAGGLWTLVFVLLRRRRRARSAVVIAGKVLAVALIGCFLFGIASLIGLPDLIPVSERSMVGTWVVHYRTVDGRPAGTDTLILKPDHTFIQICLPEKGKKIEASLGIWPPGPIKRYNRVRMVGTWRIVSGDIEIEEALDPPMDGMVAGNPYARVATTLGLPIKWQIGGPVIEVDDHNDVYFRKVK